MSTGQVIENGLARVLVPENGLRLWHDGEAACEGIEEVFGGSTGVVGQLVTEHSVVRLETETALSGQGLDGFGDASILGIFSVLAALDQGEFDAPAHGFVDEVRVEEVLLPCSFDGDLDGPELGVDVEDFLGDFRCGSASGPGMEDEDEGGRAVAGDNEGAAGSGAAGGFAATGGVKDMRKADPIGLEALEACTSPFCYNVRCG